MMRFITILSFAAGIALSSGCTSGDAVDAGQDAQRSTHACNGPTIDGGRTSCLELEGTGMPTCNGGTLTDGPCDRTGAVGGCLVAQGENMITTWYFTSDASTVQMLCSRIGGAFVAP